MIRNEGDRLRRVIVCSPGNEYFSVTNKKAHNFNQIADAKTASLQHKKLRSVLIDFGCELIEMEEFSGFPNSVFTRDTALCTPNGYISLNMGL
ncbi:MAG: amidinotransferase, partial [Ignavibacteria bacterium]|nr:amidinotransferase [Ignavibacteria bacterium]